MAAGGESVERPLWVGGYILCADSMSRYGSAECLERRGDVVMIGGRIECKPDGRRGEFALRIPPDAVAGCERAPPCDTTRDLRRGEDVTFGETSFAASCSTSVRLWCCQPCWTLVMAYARRVRSWMGSIWVFCDVRWDHRAHILGHATGRAGAVCSTAHFGRRRQIGWLHMSIGEAFEAAVVW